MTPASRFVPLLYLSDTDGYRTADGGADVDEVHNFAGFSAAVISGVDRS